MADSKDGGKGKGLGKQVSRGVVWVILLLLIVGLAGFGATSFGGTTRALGSVGDTEIDIDRYARALQQELRAVEAQTGERLSFAEAQRFGLDRQVLGRVIALTAMEDEADALGISVGDEAVRREVLGIDAFRGLDGQFDAESYRVAVEQAGESVADFEEGLREEAARTLLQGAVVAGIAPPPVFVDTLYAFAREERDVTVLRFAPDGQAAPEPPTEAELRAFHEANPDLYTAPERRRIAYAWARPETLADAIEIDDAALRRLYDEQEARFNQPERRLAERLVFEDAAAAEAAAAAIEAGETEFDALVAERGLALEDVDLGDVSRADLGQAADAVFALEGPGVTGPVETGLGPAIFRVNAVLQATTVPFEEAREDLAVDARLDAARRLLEDEIEPVEDLLAGGATVEEVAEESALAPGTILWSEGEASAEGADLDAYPAFRQAAAALEDGDFPELIELGDGGLAVLRLDEVVPAAMEPYEAVADRVAGDFAARAAQAALMEEARAAEAALAEGRAADALGAPVETVEGLLRDSVVDTLPPTASAAVFALAEGGTTVIEAGDGAALIRLDAVRVPAADSAEAVEIKSGVGRQIGQQYAQDLTEMYAEALQAEKGIQLDQAAINAVHAQFP